MRAARTATTRDVTGINRTAILDVLREAGAGTRRDIRLATGLGPATIDRLTRALLGEGRIRVAGSTSPSVGRPSELLVCASPGRSILALDVTGSAVRARTVDLAGTVVGEVSRNVALGDSAGDRAAARRRCVRELAAEVLAGPPAGAGRIEALGVSVPGMVQDGVVREAVELEWDAVPLGEDLETVSGLPVHLENDANATAYGELTFGAARGEDCAVALVLGRGMGAGLVIDGNLHHGARAGAGEIGRLFTNGAPLEEELSDVVEPWAGRGGDPHDLRLGPAFRRMMTLGVGGEARASFFDRLAVACAAISVVVAPGVLVLAGAFAEYAEESIVELRTRLEDRVPVVPRLAASALGFDAAITGVAELTLARVRGATYLSGSRA